MPATTYNVRGKKRELKIEELRRQLAGVRAAWKRGRQWRITSASLGLMLRDTSSESVTAAADALRDAVLDSTADAPLLEKLAFSIWPASPADDDDEWFLAWMEIARLADMPEGLALEVVQVSADDYRRTRRRRREAIRSRLLREVGGVYSFNPATGTTALDAEYAAKLDLQADLQLRYGHADLDRDP